MTCKDFLEHYSAWRDGLAPDLSEEFEAHLDRCASCRAHHLAVQRGVEALRDGVLTPSPHFEARLVERLKRGGTGEDPSPRVAPLAAAAMVLLLLATLLFTTRRPTVVSTAAAEAEKPSVARPRAQPAPPFVIFVPGR